jgi:hypothetical protein
MQETRFTMYEEISHLKMPILTNRRRSETVLAPDVKDWEDYGQVQPMLFPVDQFRALFCDDLEIRCGLVVEDKKEESLVHHVDELPSNIAIACLLNPLVGGMSYLYWREQPIAVTNFSCLYEFPLLGRKRLLKAEAMSNSQYDAAETEVLSRMQRVWK